MERFVDIVQMFSPDERSVEKLAHWYSDADALNLAVQKLLSNRIESSDLQGKRVLLKPNWVRHSKSAHDPLCLRTHESVVLACLRWVLLCKPASVVIGDAPIQGCHWEKMVDATFLGQIQELADSAGIKVLVKDFRRVTFDPDKNNPNRDRVSLEEFLIFDVGKRSYLEPITTTENKFRVTQYNPDRFILSHKPGMHKYCITKELFRADVVISLPKVKTHQKAGITAALKNIVGLNGDKDFLPHHRIGGTDMGGDSYPGKNYLRYLTEICHDAANRLQGTIWYTALMRAANVFWRISLPGPNHQTAAAWFGNDTTWRMVLDLNLILQYGTSDGRLADTPQRVMYSLSDGIVGGQADGPLKPEPLALGFLALTNDSGLHDLALATLMGMQIGKVPLLAEVLAARAADETGIRINSEEVSLSALKQFAIKATMPPGWLNYDA